MKDHCTAVKACCHTAYQHMYCERLFSQDVREGTRNDNSMIEMEWLL